MAKFVEFKQVSHTYITEQGTPVPALNDVNFSIDKHQFVAVVGPSGCGKSTLLRLLSGLIPASEGLVNVYGHAVTEPREDVGIVFQKPTLLPWLSILDNVLFPLKHKYNFVSVKDKKRAIGLIEMVGLGDFLGQKPEELSGGMQQRIGIARALLLDPDILIMDEPFSALDALSREEMGFELQRIWQEKPKTVLFITHSISEAVLLADKVLIMSHRPGTIAQELDIDLARPRDIDTINDPQFAKYTNIIRKHIYQPKQVSPNPQSENDSPLKTVA
ncbi:ABC transporter ATP-binding protein [Alginatibacterium sediminis]|uniref:ABC transporter ATP-binding protein n=1 Tax=Alginatibacterium sediminis TaxID=2164068 RepID=A0A420E7P3_9ALTE|nr:ABC transporter ATP-binding protein [Alginatibacterium sediminis]RKF13732.1 ABC transporter ATP-binding protein [Alginatibacterium sediminis]